MASPPRRSIRWPSLGQLWAFLAVALPVLAALLAPMSTVDLTYHLRAGADILAGHGIPTTDSWTFTIAGDPWLDQQWGAQVLLAGVYQAAGWTGLALLRAALVGLTFGLLLATIRSAWSRASVRSGGSAIASSARTATLVVLVAFAVAAPGLALRPQLFGIALFAATALVLAERATHPRRLWLIPVFAAAWANLHGSFPLVVVLVGLAWLDEIAFLREPPPPGQPPRRLPQRLLGSTGLAIIGAASALATLATPFGIDGWRYIENLARNRAISQQVSEWRPPSPLDLAAAPFYLSLLVAVGVLAFRFRSDGRRPPARFLAPIVTLVVFGLLGVATGRGLAWWALTAPVAIVSLQPGLRLADVRVPGLPKVQVRARTAREASASEERRSPLNAAVMGVLILASVALLPLWRPLGPAGVPNALLSQAPQQLTARLRSFAPDLDQPFRVWAPQTWASWLEFAVPNALVAVDSRIELYPAELWAEAQEVATGTGDWQGVLAGHGFPIVVVAPEQAGLDRALEQSGAWSPIYHDTDGAIWIPRGEPRS